ncbi:MAG TPA: hypothetical protein PKE64_04445 [Anaerolineae bacterium]|nr:hypothetical protein [Anaerolineae bacterium]
MRLQNQIRLFSVFAGVMLVVLALGFLPTPAAADGPYCRNLDASPKSIPDSQLGGPSNPVPGPILTDSLTVTDIGLITDLNMTLVATHTFVGDLRFTLIHKVADVTLSSARVISMPLFEIPVISRTHGEHACDGDDINVTLDDEASLSIQNNCNVQEDREPPEPAYIDGESYRPAESLNAAFVGQTIAGEWILEFTDNVSGDVGSLFEWCLEPSLAAAPNLQITKSANVSEASPGQNIIYTLNYTNTGGPATGVVVTETLPTNTRFEAAASHPGWTPIGADQYRFNLNNLATNGKGAISFTVTVDDPFPAGENSVTNQAQIGDDGSKGADSAPLDNTTGNVVTPINAPQPAPVLNLIKIASASSVSAGDLITYTLTYSKTGDQANNVEIVETLPNNTSFVGPTGGAGWARVDSTNQYKHLAGTISVSTTQSVEFVVQVNSPLPKNVTVITNTAVISGSNVSPVSSNLVSTSINGVNFSIYLPLIVKPEE